MSTEIKVSELSHKELHVAELAILLMQLRALERIDIDLIVADRFSLRDKVALKEAKRRSIAKLKDQVVFNEGMIAKLGGR